MSMMTSSKPKPRIDFGRVHLADDSAKPRRFYNLEPTTAMVEMHYGGFLVFDTRNIDTMPGPVREGWAEPWNDILLRALLKEGSVYVNAGANYGYFTVLGGLLVGGTGKAISFEANPSIFKHLMRSLFYSGTITRTELFNRAVSNTTGDKLVFRFDLQYTGGGAIDYDMPADAITRREPEDSAWNERTIPGLLDDNGMWVYGRGLPIEFETTTITIDKALGFDEGGGRHGPVDVLQMDIEGAEPMAILGAKQMIARSPDLRIIMEWFGQYYQRAHLRQPIEEMWDFLVNEEGFRAFHITPPTSHPYTKAPEMVHVPDFETFCALPHGEVYLDRAEPKF